MWSKEKKDMLSIIYGDDLVLVGDVVVARDAENKTCKIINTDGEMLVPEPVLGIAQFLGRGGFHYVLVTERKERKNTSTRRDSYVSPAANNKHYFNYVSPNIGRYPTFGETKSVEYTYKIFNSKFEYTSVGTARASGVDVLEHITIEVGDRFHDVMIRDCMLVER